MTSLSTCFRLLLIPSNVRTIKLESSLETNNSRNIVRRHGSIEFLQASVQIRHVRVVVFGVVNRHSFGRDGSYEGMFV